MFSLGPVQRGRLGGFVAASQRAATKRKAGQPDDASRHDCGRRERTEVQVDVLTMPTVTIQDGGGSITIDGSVSVSGSVAVTGQQRFSHRRRASWHACIRAIVGRYVCDFDAPCLGMRRRSGDRQLWISRSTMVDLSFDVDGTVARRSLVTWTVGLSSGTNGIGKPTANSGVTIGAVEIAASQTLATVTTVTTVTTVGIDRWRRAVMIALTAGTLSRLDSRRVLVACWLHDGRQWRSSRRDRWY